MDKNRFRAGCSWYWALRRSAAKLVCAAGLICAGPPASAAEDAGYPLVLQVEASSGVNNPLEALCSGPRSAEECGERFYANAEFLYWATQGVSVAPMLTTGLGPVGQAGVPGFPQTQVLFGGQRMLNDMRPGIRVEVGYWLDDEQNFGISGRFYTLGKISHGLTAGSNGSTVLALPIQLATPGWVPAPQPFPATPPFLPSPTVIPALTPPPGAPLNQAIYISYPGLVAGAVDVNTTSDFLGFNLDARNTLIEGESTRMDVFAGYRYMTLGDQLNRSFDTGTINASGILTGSRLMGNDSWRTRNYFHGPEVGMNLTHSLGPVNLTLETAFAMGVTCARMDINQTVTLGSLQTQIPIYQVGGSDSTSYFSVVPEVGVKVGYSPIEGLNITGGYSLIYWSRVRRAQTQYDLTPVTVNDPVDFWAQGWNVGVELRY